MIRKRCHRRPVMPQPPRGMRQKLTRDQLRDVALAHVVNVDAIARGDAQPSILWDMARAAFCWSFVAEEMQAGIPEMTEQIRLVQSLIDRYRRTGRVGFSGQELQVARSGTVVMDMLAEECGMTVAQEAALRSEELIARMCREVKA